MADLGFNLVPGRHPIIPVMLGDARLAADMADELLREAIYVTRSEEHTSELQSLMRISYAVFCLKKQNKIHITQQIKQLRQLTYKTYVTSTLMTQARHITT